MVQNLIKIDEDVNLYAKFFKMDSLKTFKPNIPFFNSSIVDIQNINDSIILFSSSKEGLCVYNVRNNSYQIYSKKDNLISNFILQTYYKNGSIVTISQKGLSLIKGTKVQNYSTLNGLLSNNIINVVIKDDTLWVATDKGISIIPVYSIKNGKTRIYLKQIGYSGDIVPVFPAI